MTIDLSKKREAVRRLINKKEWSRAAKAQLTIARALPTDIESWAETVRLRRAAREDEEPVWSEAATVLADNPKNIAELLACIAQWHGEASRWEECVSACDAVLRNNPRHHAALEMKSAALLHSGDIEGATQSLQSLIRLSPRDPLHRLKYATLLQLQNETPAALREYERVLAAHPNAPFAEEARNAVELLDGLQMQQVMMRASEDLAFRREIQNSLDDALRSSGFYISDGARETLRQNLSDGRPKAPLSPPRVH